MPFIKPSSPPSIADNERKAERDWVGLIAELDHPNAVARRWAARDLVDYPEATEALVARLKREDKPSVREAILMTLTRLGDPLAIAGLVECLRSEDAALRNEAVEAMKALPEQVAPIMGGLLTDDDSDVRIFAVNILESLRHPEVENWLVTVIAHEPHVNVCATAVDLLGEVGTEASRAALHQLKARFPDEPYIQFAAALALKRLGEG